MTTTKNRQTDPGEFTLTRDEFVAIARNGNGKSSAFKDWLRVIVAVAVPCIVLITFFNETAFQVRENKSDIMQMSSWIEEHSKDTSAIRTSISDVSRQQAVILEKVITLQKDIENLNDR